MKVCTSCSVDKSAAEFRPDPRYAGGITAWCRDCLNDYKRAHRASNTERVSYDAMISRCVNQNDVRYGDYGGRGISVCSEWMADFSVFLSDMGARPDGTSIDRLDVNGDYEPSNCRWATPVQQGNNRRNNKKITFNGVSMTQSEWTRELGFSKGTIYNRLKSGWSVEDALTKPVNKDVIRNDYK